MLLIEIMLGSRQEGF